MRYMNIKTSCSKKHESEISKQRKAKEANALEILFNLKVHIIKEVISSTPHKRFHVG